MNQTTTGIESDTLAAALAEREQLLSAGLQREMDLLERSESERAQRTAWWESQMTEIRRNSSLAQLSSYKSMAGSLGVLLGASVKAQAKVMVPFEIAEATRELARFLGTRDPQAMASSLKHLAAARQYAAVAKAAASGSAGGGGTAAGGSSKKPKEESDQSRRQARVIVNVGRQVGLVDTYEFARGLIEAINENLADDVILEVAS